VYIEIHEPEDGNLTFYVEGDIFGQIFRKFYPLGVRFFRENHGLNIEITNEEDAMDNGYMSVRLPPGDPMPYIKKILSQLFKYILSFKPEKHSSGNISSNNSGSP
jgi:hypothetical protein